MQQKNYMFPDLDWIGIFRKVLDQVEEERKVFQEMERRREKVSEKAEDENESDPGTKPVNTDQRSEVLQVPKSWVYDRTSRNKVPHYKLGKNLRFDLNRIQEWLAEYRNE